MYGSVYIDDAINWDCSLNDGLMERWIALPNQQRGVFFRGLCKNDGTLTNGPTWAGRPNGGYGSLLFDGSNDYVTMPSIPALNSLTSTTASIWFASTQGGSFQRIFVKGTTDWELIINQTGSGATGTICWYVPGVAVLESAAGFLDGNWHQATGTINSAGMKFYIDGNEVATGGAAGLTSTSAVVQMGRYAGGGGQYAGRLDDGRIWDRALPAAEVKTVYLESRRGSPETLKWYKRKAYSFIDAGGGFSPYWAARNRSRIIGGGVV